MSFESEIVIDAPQGLRPEAPSRFERREAQVARILEGARLCFLKSGFQGASMGDICAAAGMSPGALYRYFPSKESLIEAICALNRENDAMILAGIAKADSIVDGMTAGFMAHAKQVHESGMAPLFAEIFAEAKRNIALNQILECSLVEVNQVITAALNSALAKGEINPILPLDQLLPIMMAMCDGLITSDLPRIGIKIESMQPAVKALIVGLLRPSGTTPAIQKPDLNPT